MNRTRIKRSTAFVLLGIIVGLFLASVVAGIMGNAPLFMGLFVFDGFFVIVTYFSLQLHRNIKGSGIDDDDAHDNDDDDDSYEHAEYDLDDDETKNK